MTDHMADVWTPRIVRDRLVEAVRWVRYETGPVGPAGYSSSMPHSPATLADHLEMGWGLPESADGADEAGADRPLRIEPSPQKISRMVETLRWPAVYLGEKHPGSARMLSLWLKCRTQGGGKGFDSALRKVSISRGHAYRLRDRGLSVIAQGLSADGRPVE